MATFESKFHDVLVKGGADRVNFLNISILSMATEYVFEYLVMDYHHAPTKKKAIALYEVFILDTPYQLNCNEKLGPAAQIHKIIDFYRQSSQMNVLQKIALAGLRSADKHIFDDILRAAFRQEAISDMNNRLADAAKGRGPSKKGSIADAWVKVRNKLVTAGFACIACTC